MTAAIAGETGLRRLPHGDVALAEQPDQILASPASGLIPAQAGAPRRFLDRENSWLDFNSRILWFAADPRTPLLERLRFLAFFSDNLDEFFMVRIARLKRLMATGADSFCDGPPEQHIESVAHRIHELVATHGTVLDEVQAALTRAGIAVPDWEQLGAREQARLRTVFTESICPVLTPLAVDPAHPFPHVSGLSLNLAVRLRDRDTGEARFARVEIPPLLPALLPVADQRFVRLEDVVSAHLPELFPGMAVVESECFRVTRSQELDEDDADHTDALASLERSLLRRRFGPAVRLEVAETMSRPLREVLTRELALGEVDTYPVANPLGLGAAVWTLTAIDRPELKYPLLSPNPSTRLPHADERFGTDAFAVLREQDVLVHHPYDNFAATVEAFVHQAAVDPAVVSIRQTLYRTSGDSSIIAALIRAAQAGKQVVVLVEIRARFDERANIRWARALEEAGCRVVHGPARMKIHCNLSIVVRRELDGTLRRYTHIGTGNYNPSTARSHEDFGLLTAAPDVGDEVGALFDTLCGQGEQTDCRTLLVAPFNLRAGIIRMVEAQRRRALAGRPALIRMKLNNLVDSEIIESLYRAAQAGARVDLVIRGMCTLQAGVPGLSDNIQVRSILGRFLEHSRVMQFGVGGRAQIWIGSADVMHRNLDHRVEVMVQVRDPRARQAVRDVLDLAMSPHVSAWELQPDASWVRRAGEPDSELLDYQEQLIHHYQGRSLRLVSTDGRRERVARAATALPRGRSSRLGG